MTIQATGSQLVTASGVVGGSGKNIRLFSINIISGGNAGTINLRNGTTSSATIFITEVGTANQGKTVIYGTEGFLFPGGLYMSIDANTTSVLAQYSQY